MTESTKSEEVNAHENLGVISSFANVKVMMRANHDIIWWIYIFSHTNKRVPIVLEVTNNTIL